MAKVPVNRPSGYWEELVPVRARQLLVAEQYQLGRARLGYFASAGNSQLSRLNDKLPVPISFLEYVNRCVEVFEFVNFSRCGAAV
jgi:hypothetical protein